LKSRFARGVLPLGPVLRRTFARDSRHLLGHRDEATTMIYTRDLNRGRRSVGSPLDGEDYRTAAASQSLSVILPAHFHSHFRSIP
jgi:hypothetical protein